MSYQLYRSMSLGESLKAALDDLIEKQLITPDLALKASEIVELAGYYYPVSSRCSSSMTAA